MRKTLPIFLAALLTAAAYSALAQEVKQPEGRSTVDPVPGAGVPQQTPPAAAEPVVQPEGRSSTETTGASVVVEPQSGGGGDVTQPEGRSSPDVKN